MKASRTRVAKKSCPRCGSPLFEVIRPFTMERSFFGIYPFWVCSQCGNVLTPPATYDVLEKVARAKGWFGARSDRIAILQPLATVKGLRATG